jgi:DNA-binding CsgD family transcriptional regulator
VTGARAAFPGSAARAALFEREGEVAALVTVVGEAAEGQPRVVVVEGEAGIGKTRLLAETRRLADAAGIRLLSARGGELEREFAFGVVRQLFDSHLSGGDLPLLDGAAAAARGVFELGDGRDTIGSEHPSFAALHGLYWLTVNLCADRPLVIAVDDLHWCDAPSLRFLAYLVRRLEGLPVAVVCTLRPSEQVEAAALGEIIGDPLTVSIHPAPLSAPAVARLVRERLGNDADEAFWTACHAATSGNPLLLHELLRTLGAERVRPDAAHVATVAELGPRAASRAVLVRLARLSQPAVKLAGAAAILGDDAELSTVVALADIEVKDAGAAVASLVRAEILREGTPLGFVHPVVGGAVLADMGTVERAVRHERAARLLADGGAPVERVAAHLLASPANGEGWVVETLTRAATAALRKGAAESAVAYLARALREPPDRKLRAKLLLELGRAEALTSGAAAVAHLGEAYELLDEERERVAAAQLLGRVLLVTGHTAEAAALVRGAAAELPAELEDLRRSLEALELMAVLLDGSDDETRRRLRHHRRRPVGAGVGAKMLAAVAAHDWMLSGGPSDACTELALEALAGGELVAADNGLLGVTAIVVLAVADRDEAMEVWEYSLADAYRRGSLLSKKSVTLWRGFTQYWRGELADAEESLRSSAEGKRYGLGPEAWLYNHAVLSAVLRERGDLTGARRVLEGSSDLGNRSDATRYWLNSKLELLVAEGRFGDALVVAEDFVGRFGHIASPIDTPWRPGAVLALRRLGREPEARALAAQELEQARRWGSPATMARALRAMAPLEKNGVELLREAADLLAASPARLEHAKVLAALGAALRKSRRPTDARAPLRRALELAEAVGAQDLAGHVRTELYAAGGRPRTTALVGIEALTPSERRVAGLAAAGHTNREIAQELFVTPKTIELHLSNAYRKLGIRSRRELPDQIQAG